MPSDPFSTSREAVACDDLMEELASGDDAVLSGPARAHVAQCLRCQAEMAAFRRLRRSMSELAHRGPAVMPLLEQEILVMLDDEDGRTRRVPGYAAAAMGGLAAAAGVIALATRQRRSARLAG